jgi:uncharacterized protein (TIGR00297 family)
LVGVVLINLLLGAVVSLAIALFAFRWKALDESGTVTAAVLGVVLFAIGWELFAIMMAFFASATFVTRYKALKKENVSKEFAKGGVRDAWQVFANGAPALAVALAYYASQNAYAYIPLSPSALFVAFAAAVAVVNADTFATELGVLYGRSPRMITNLKPAVPGTSGAVSAQGLLASLFGALVVALFAGVVVKASPSFSALGVAGAAGGMALLAVIAVAGFAGSLADSFLGATVQVMYWCPKCKKPTEREVHKCGTLTRWYKGLGWFNNDVVNLIAAFAGIAVALLVATA